MNRPRRSALRPSAAVVAAGVLLVSLLLLPGLALGTPGAAGGARAGAAPQNPSWASYPSGGIRVVFPSTLPEVELDDASNSTLGAVLEVTGILELVAGGLPHPTVVAAAFPMAQAAFNSTRAAEPAATPVSQLASRELHSFGVSLCSATGVATYLGARLGSAALFLNYTVLPSGAGIAIQWSVVGWPWVSTGDLLALELHLVLTPGAGVTPCTGLSTPGALPAACATAPIPENGIAWDPTITSVVANGPAGDSASLAWNRSTTTPGASTSGMIVGTFASQSSSADVVLGSPAGGAAKLSGALSFSLFPPAAPMGVPGPATLHGAFLPYLAVSIGSAAFAAAGIALYRRRERRTREEL
jgi:hypothetical protein